MLREISNDASILSPVGRAQPVESAVAIASVPGAPGFSHRSGPYVPTRRGSGPLLWTSLSVRLPAQIRQAAQDILQLYALRICRLTDGCI